MAEKKLSKKALNKSFRNWFYGHLTCFSQEHMQTFGYLCAMLPLVEELYETREEQTEALKTYSAFFNTEPQLGTVIVGMTAGLEEAKANGEDIDGEMINGIRAGLMGPVAGIGDSLLVGTLIPILLGVALGLIVAVVRTAHDQQRAGHKNVLLGVFNAICKIYTTVIRGTPMMVQLLIMSLVIFASSRNYTMIGILTLGINSGAYVSEIVRSGLMSVDPGQMEAGRSLGLNYFTTMRFVVIPQAVKNILPALGNEFITLLKDTSLITVIGGKELTYAAKAIIAKTYQGLFPLFGIALMYLLLVMLFSKLLSVLERRLRQSDRR